MHGIRDDGDEGVSTSTRRRHRGAPSRVMPLWRAGRSPPLGASWSKPDLARRAQLGRYAMPMAVESQLVSRPRAAGWLGLGPYVGVTRDGSGSGPPSKCWIVSQTVDGCRDTNGCLRTFRYRQLPHSGRHIRRRCCYSKSVTSPA